MLQGAARLLEVRAQLQVVLLPYLQWHSFLYPRKIVPVCPSLFLSPKFIQTFPLFASFPPHHAMTNSSPETILPPCCLFCVYASLHLGCEPNTPLSSKKAAMEQKTILLGTYKLQTATHG